MKKEIRNISVKTNKGTLERNERSTNKFLHSSRRQFEIFLDTVVLTGNGAYKLYKYIGEDGLMDVIEEIQATLDLMPVYSECRFNLEIVEFGIKMFNNVKFVKQTEETKKFLAEYFVPEF